MSAARWCSLAGRGGPDDLFSSDFSDEELSVRLGHMGTAGQRAGRPAALPPALPGPFESIEPVEHPGLRTVFVHSGADEYVPPSVDVDALAKRFVRAAGGALNGASAVIIQDANHNLAEPVEVATQTFVDEVSKALKDVVV